MPVDEESYNESISYKFGGDVNCQKGKGGKEMLGKGLNKNTSLVLKGLDYGGVNTYMQKEKDYKRWNSVYGDSSTASMSDYTSEDDMGDRASSVYHDT